MRLSVLTIIIVVILSLGCNRSTTEPNDDPISYQKDISWPSLANSPWPMYRCDPQNTGRSRFAGPKQFCIEWMFLLNSDYINSSLVIGKDSTIYANYDRESLIGIKQNREINWKGAAGLRGSPVTPIIASDGTIYHFSSGGLVAINQDGKVKWNYNIILQKYSMNIGKDGTIYFVANNMLNAIGSDGVIKWQKMISGIDGGNSGLTFSPDGSTIYIPGNSSSRAIYAIDVISKTIKWEFGFKGNMKSFPVDNNGNIYLSGSNDSLNQGKSRIYSLTSEGKVRWSCAHTNQYVAVPTIDKTGNIYFVTDSIYSFDFRGNFRWSKSFTNSTNQKVTTPLICDNYNNIYIVIDNSGQTQFDVLMIDNDGNTLNRINSINMFSGDSPIIGLDRLYVPSGNGSEILSIK